MKTLSTPIELAPTRKATLLECLLAAVASGALLAFALPPFDVPLLGFVALAPMMAAVLRASAIPALICTLLTGIVSGAVMTAFLSGIGDGFGSPTLALAYFAVFGVAMWFPLMSARVLGAGRTARRAARSVLLGGRGVALGAADAGVAHLRRIPRGQRCDTRCARWHTQRAVLQDVSVRGRAAFVGSRRPCAGVPVAVRDAQRGDLLRHDVHRAVSSAGVERRTADCRADF